jgi:hypothetical protein
MFSKPEAASRSSVYRCTQRYGAMAELGRAAKQDRRRGAKSAFSRDIWPDERFPDPYKAK